MCWIHRRYQKHLNVHDSTIPHAGKGTFAWNGTNNDAVVFEKNKKLMPYDGEIINTTTLENRYGPNTAPYGVEIQHNLYEDAALHRGIGSIVNQANERRRVNARLMSSPGNQFNHHPHIEVVSTKPIKNKQEILVHYGDEYRLHEPNVTYQTNKSRYHLVT